MDSDVSKKNPYDFESDDDDETIKNSKQRTISGTSNDSNDTKNQINLFKENPPYNDEHMHHSYRVPPLKIVLARTVVHKTTDIER
jgi:hypothetical protein